MLPLSLFSAVFYIPEALPKCLTTKLKQSNSYVCLPLEGTRIAI